MSENICRLHVDLNNIFEIALIGVRRAAVFMGLGVNAALREDFKDFRLTSFSHFDFIPSEIPPETLAHYKEEFRYWVEAGGLRELTETFAVCLDHVFGACFALKNHQTKNFLNEYKKKSARFCRKSFPDKITHLKETFSVAPGHPDCLLSINHARNCLAHRRGVVSAEDLDGEQVLSVEWVGMDLFIETPNGKRIPIETPITEAIVLSEGGYPGSAPIIRKRQYHLGEKAALSTKDLAEICWFYTTEARALLDSVLAFAAREGIEVKKV